MKIRETCLDSTRILEGSGPISKNKINARWIKARLLLRSLHGHEELQSNHLIFRRLTSIYKASTEVFSMDRSLKGMSSLMNNLIQPPLELQSNLYGSLNPRIRN